MLRALYAAISLRFGKFLISDPGVSLFGILPLRGEKVDADHILDLEVVPTPLELATHLHPRPLGDGAEHLVVAVVPASFRWW